MSTDTAASGGSSTGGRRRWLWGAAAGLAALAGVGVGWWRSQPQGSDAQAAQALAGLWAMKFERPGGGELALADFKGRPLLINFWATWCPPCVEELPMLDRFQRESAGKSWQVLGLAIDQPSSVARFLARTPLGFPIGLAGLEGSELGRSLGNESGGLPFSVVIAADGRVVQRKMGKIAPEELAQWTRAS